MWLVKAGLVVSKVFFISGNLMLIEVSSTVIIRHLNQVYLLIM